MEVTLRPLTLRDAPLFFEVRLRNRDFLTPYEPFRPARAFTLEGIKQQIMVDEDARDRDARYAFGVYADKTLVGRISLDNVVRGAWQNATLGYFIDQDHNGRGIATEAVRRSIDFAFGEIRLHRVQAGVMPRNEASIRVLTKAGFRFEGLAPRYLQINGSWEDHNLYAITSEEWHSS